MQDELDFPDDILANPRDDRPKLEYAEWLESMGDTELAERIRLPAPTAADVRGRTRRARGWARYAKELLCGVVPPSWDVWPIEHPDADPERHVCDEEGRREDLNSWPYSAGSRIFQVSRPYFVVSFRHGFISSVAAPIGRLMKVLPALFRSQPVVEVGVTCQYFDYERDLRPMRLENVTAARAVRLLANRIPPPIFDHLTPPEWRAPIRDRARTYPTLTAAYEDLSRAVVAYGRSLAGLPPLPPAQ